MATVTSGPALPDLGEHRASAAGFDIRLRTAAPLRGGGRPPALLVHGLGVSSGYMVPLARQLSCTRQVLLPDLPGHGRSSRPPRQQALDEREQALVLAELIETQAGSRPVLLVANSWGCQVAVELCVRRPDLVVAAVLLGPTVDVHHHSLPAQASRLLSLGLLEPPALVARQVVEYLQTGAIRAIREFRHGQQHDMLGTARRVMHPVLVARGEQDPVATDRWTRDLVSALPHGRSATFQGAAHVLNWWPAPLVAAAIDAFAERALRFKELASAADIRERWQG
jgi:2-hydroxy-6-oxonona-2,4-dienedioate hydrolase